VSNPNLNSMEGSFRLQMIEGITTLEDGQGPLIRQVVEVYGDKDLGTVVWQFTKPPRDYGSTQGDITPEHVKTLLDDFVAELSKLPGPNASYPFGEDVFGFDFGIELDLIGFHYRNSGLDNIIRTKPEWIPNEEQKAIFKTLVDKLLVLAKDYATGPRK